MVFNAVEDFLVRVAGHSDYTAIALAATVDQCEGFIHFPPELDTLAQPTKNFVIVVECGKDTSYVVQRCIEF